MLIVICVSFSCSSSSLLCSAIVDVIGAIQEAKEEGLEHFCEFIEDCEFPDLSVKILHLLGEEGPK